jgi:alpha-amylase
MPSVCIYFQVHQPLRLSKFTVFSKAEIPYKSYFDWDKNKKVFDRVARKCYLPTNELLLRLIDKNDSKFRISFSLTGVFVEQAERFNHDVLETFKQLFETGCVDFLDETYYHSLVSLYSEGEFIEQVKEHRQMIKSLVNYKPTVFRNTEALFSNSIAKTVELMGYKAILAEGADYILGWRSPNFIYTPPNSNLKVLLRNYRLSDDIGFRFSSRNWKEWPLMADKYASWLSRNEGQCVNLFMDYETFGEHQWEDTGIFGFLEHLPGEVLKHGNLDFKTTKEVAESYEPVGTFDVPHIISWADIERDASAWLGNEMQVYCFEQLKSFEEDLKKNKDEDLLHIWRLLQTSDNLYYLCTKWWADGDVHKYFNPYDSPYDAFVSYANIINDFREKVANARSP